MMRDYRYGLLALAVALAMLASAVVIPMAGGADESEGAAAMTERALVGGLELNELKAYVGKNEVQIDRLDLNIIGKMRETRHGYVAEAEIALVARASVKLDFDMDMPETGEYVDEEFISIWTASLKDGLSDDPRPMNAKATITIAAVLYASVTMDKQFNVMSIDFGGRAFGSARLETSFTFGLAGEHAGGVMVAFDGGKPMSEWISLYAEANGSLTFSEPLNMFNAAGEGDAWENHIHKAVASLHATVLYRLSDGADALLKDLMLYFPGIAGDLHLDDNGFVPPIRMEKEIHDVEILASREKKGIMGVDSYEYEVYCDGGPEPDETLTDLANVVGKMATYIRALDTALVPAGELDAYRETFNKANRAIDEFLGVAEVTVAFGNGAGGEIARKSVGFGDRVRPPSTPLPKLGYEFVGWTHGGALWDFNDPVRCDMTLQPLYGHRVENFKDDPWDCHKCLIVEGRVIPDAAVADMGADSILVVRAKDGQRTHEWVFYARNAPWSYDDFINVGIVLTRDPLDADAKKAVEGRTNPVFLDFFNGRDFDNIDARVRCDVGGFYDKGTNLTLYRLQGDTLIAPQKCRVGEDGYVSFKPTGCYDHVLVVDGPGQAPAGDAAFVGIGAAGLMAIGSTFFLGRRKP